MGIRLIRDCFTDVINCKVLLFYNNASLSLYTMLILFISCYIVLHTLSAAFDTIDQDNLFCILEKYVGICGNALKLIKSYFSNRSQRGQIDDVLSDFAYIIFCIPQGSVLGPLKFCLYLLPMSAILKYHKIGYHVYADDSQLYISFKLHTHIL